MDLLQDQREAVRKSIVRISFNWPTATRNSKKKTKTVVICGVILSIKDGGSCFVIADPIFFRQENCPFVVNLPTATGYDAAPVAPSAKFLGQCFCVLVLPANDYVQPVTLETTAVQTLDDVNAFVFPREDYFTPTGYVPGYVAHGEKGLHGKFHFGIPFHSVAHFGAPIFNGRGHLLGISHAPMYAWSVSFIQQRVLYWEWERDITSVLGRVSYVLNGNPIPPEGTTLAGTVPPV